MSPVERGPRVTPRTAVVLAVSGVVIGLGLLLVISALASRGDVVEIRLGDDTFDAGRADRVAEQVADGGPILFPDLVGGTRTIYLQHLGDDEEEGWLAFDARQPGAPAECVLTWVDEDGHFEDSCDGTAFPADGEGLTSYPVEVTDDRVIVDLNAAFRTTTTLPRAGDAS